MDVLVAKHVQYCIYYATELDESSSPIDMAIGKDELFSWCCAVNLIYRCLVSGIWTAKHASRYMPAWFEENGLRDDYDFCKKLSENSPFVYNEINMRYWSEPIFCNTEFGQSFVESFGLENLETEVYPPNEVYPPFIDALEKLFDEKGVSWEAGDLFSMGVQLD